MSSAFFFARGWYLVSVEVALTGAAPCTVLVFVCTWICVSFVVNGSSFETVKLSPTSLSPCLGFRENPRSAVGTPPTGPWFFSASFVFPPSRNSAAGSLMLSLHSPLSQFSHHVFLSSFFQCSIAPFLQGPELIVLPSADLSPSPVTRQPILQLAFSFTLFVCR